MKISKKLSRVLTFITIAMIFSIPAAKASYTDREGPYDVIIEEYTGPDWNGDSENDFFIYRPAEMEYSAHPIIVFCIGTGSRPDSVMYEPYLERYASHGFVVIAGTDGDQQDGEQAIAGLDWLIRENHRWLSVFYRKLETGKILTMGHSQGGHSAIKIALSDDAPEITAILSIMPGNGVINGGSFADYEDIDIPVFFVSAQYDSTIMPYMVLRKYYQTDSPAWYACHRYTGHRQLGFETMQDVFVAWMYAHLYEDSSAESVFYGWRWEYLHGWKGQRRKNY